MTIPANHWRMADEWCSAGWRVTATHTPTGLAGVGVSQSNHAAVLLAKDRVKQRLAALQRLDLSDPRRALEELATVPSLRERAEEALEELQAVQDECDGVQDSGPCQTCGGTGKLHRTDGTPVECPDCGGEVYQSPIDALYEAKDDARDEARRLLAEVLL